MSVWSSISGETTIHKSKSISLKKLASLIFDDHGFSCDTKYDGDCYIHKWHINIREEGDRAYRDMVKWKDELNQCGSSSDIEMVIRW